MATISLIDATLPLRIVDGYEVKTLDSLRAEETIANGAAVRIVPSSTNAGYLTNAKATTNAEAAVVGLARKGVSAYGATTVIRKGVVDGFDLSSYNYWAPVYLGDSDGIITSISGTLTRLIGRVIPVDTGKVGVAPDKLLEVDFGIGPEPISNANMGNTINTGDATSDNCIDAVRDALVALGVIVDA